jgi:hypothetical protein
MPVISRGFDSATNTPKALGIFGDDAVEISEEFTSNFSFHFRAFRTINEFKESFKFNSEFGAPIVNSINLNAALEVSRSLSLDQDVLIYVMHVCGVRKRVTANIMEDKFEADTHFQHARNELHQNASLFCSKYGDSFVKRILYGGEVALVILFKRSMLEKSKHLLEELHVNVTKGVNLQQAIELLSNSAFSRLDCEIYTQAKGFTAAQLPPSDPQKFIELSAWLANFSEKFYNTTAESFQTPVGYEVESYSNILPLETKAVVENTAIRSKYFSAIARCTNVIEYYIRYYQWSGNSELQEVFLLRQQLIADVKVIFDAKIDLTDPLILHAIDGLKKIIQDLNGVEIMPRLIHEFTSDDLSRNMASTLGSFEEKRISPSFQLPILPEEILIDGFMFEVSKDNDKPLRGNLSLLYSFNRTVPFGDASHVIASHINLDTKSHAVIPPDLSDDPRLNNVNFAYHLELRRSRSGAPYAFGCMRPCLKSENDFTVKTYMINKKPAPILQV